MAPLVFALVFCLRFDDVDILLFSGLYLIRSLDKDQCVFAGGARTPLACGQYFSVFFLSFPGQDKLLIYNDSFVLQSYEKKNAKSKIHKVRDQKDNNKFQLIKFLVFSKIEQKMKLINNW